MKAKFLSALLLVVVICSCAWGASLPSVTMLSTTTCPACEQMSKVIDQLKAEYKGRITASHIYLEKNPEIAEKYKVRYVPTLIFRDAAGKEIKQEVGYRSLNQVLEVFKKAGIKI